jgi:hypothetical protein
VAPEGNNGELLWKRQCTFRSTRLEEIPDYMSDSFEFLMKKTAWTAKCDVTTSQFNPTGAQI